MINHTPNQCLLEAVFVCVQLERGIKIEINTSVAVFEEIIIHRVIHLNRNIISMFIFIGFALQRRSPVVNFKHSPPFRLWNSRLPNND